MRESEKIDEAAGGGANTTTPCLVDVFVLAPPVVIVNADVFPETSEVK